MAEYPHCDNLVLHAPEDNCKFCNESGLQEERERQGINFTGRSDPNKKPCPSQRERKLVDINRWPGNVPFTPEVEAQQEEYYKQLNDQLRDVLGDAHGH
jgi:hypothetical protein